MCKFSSKSEGVPFQPLGDLTWNDPIARSNYFFKSFFPMEDPKYRHSISTEV